MRWLYVGATVLMSASVIQGDPPAVAPFAPIPVTSESSIGVAVQATTAPRKERISERHRTELPEKTRRPAARGGVDVTPPRIDRMTPTPGRWIVDLFGLREIQIGFTEPVTIPANAINIWTVGAGAVTDFTTSYDGGTDILTVSFASPIRDDRLTIVVDFSVTDAAGNELDGEIADPASAVLPSGDGIRGGQAVFRINILQGDANRDGTVDLADATIIRDSMGLCSHVAAFDPMADLNLDGCVNVMEVAIFRLAEGRTLPTTDGTPPIVTAISEPTNGLLNGFDTVVVDFSETLSFERFNERTCFVVIDSSGLIVVPALATQPFGSIALYTFIPALPQCGTYTINISNALADQSGELLVTPTTPPVVTGLIPPPAPTLTAHTTMTTATSVTIAGSAPGATLVEVSCPTGVFTVPLTNNAFTADITLAPDSNNPIFFTALSTCSEVRSPPVMTTVTHDTVPPEIFVDFPTGGAQITTATTDVAGRVGDMLSGFMGLEVQLIVNGDTANPIDAIVDVGIGNNGTFFAASVPLGSIDQPTTIKAVATDELGNTVSKQITATRVAIPDGASQMVALPPANPDDRKGHVLTALPAPIVVQMTDTDGTTFANKVVTFKVTRSDGRLGATAAEITPITDPDDPNFNPDPGVMMYQVHTDANGEARVYWRMGHDAGCGNNRVEATSTSIEGTVAFCASAMAATASQLNIGSGSNQRAEAGGPASEPLRVWVSDGQNGVNDQAVLFTVTRGGGLVNGQPTATVTTGITGHAEVSFTLGPDPGNNVVEATLVVDPNPNKPQVARFVTFGVLRDEATLILTPALTSFMGVVLNNAMQPIGGATCTLTVGATTLPPVASGLDGRFEFNDLSVAGPAHLMVDGGTATMVNGQPITPGTYPSLPYNTVIIPNADNILPAPVLLPPLNPNSGVIYQGSLTEDLELTCEGVAGLKMIVRAGTRVESPDGYCVDPNDPMCMGETNCTSQNGTPCVKLMLNQVHADDIPMPIPDGASPPFAWTLQPSGTTFDPPIEITYPNMSGLPAGSIAYFLSFSHATSRFEIVATGHVTDDGSQIISDPGAGLSIAGWGCNCPPYSVTGDCCSGCGADCCEGTCCDCACCLGECCNGACCLGECCDDMCCVGGECCAGECCDGTCIDGVCCDGPDCGGVCCSGGESCCGGECCDGPCCEGVCCPEGGSCCDGKCCDGLCCEGQCCGAGDKSCCEGQCCAGACCETTGVCCSADNESCCNDECCPGPCCEGNCCAAGESCCGDQCCPAGQTCCNGECCDGDCCDGVCCAGGGICCNGQCCPAGSESCCNDSCCDGECCNDVCCSAGESCCGAAGCCAVGQTCCGDVGCCPTGSLCCEASGGGCCPQGTTCCGEECCPVGIVCCDGSCCPASQSCCGGDTCCDPDKCCGGLCCAANETCCAAAGAVSSAGVGQVCVPSSCSLSVAPEEGCPGSTVELTLTGNCDPDCDTMSFSMIKSVQYLTVNLPGPMPCLGSPHVDTFTVEIAPDAPPGPIVFQIIGTTAAALCDTLVTVTVLELTLTETPAVYLPENSNTVSYTATIVPGGATDLIRFELFHVSDFPGDAMNHGTQPDTEPDFKFEAAGNPDFTISSNQLVATTTTAVASATVMVTAFDYGAMGKIKATLVNLGCVSDERLIPLDTDGDTLPDAYENTQPDKDANNADTDGDGVADGIEDDDMERPVVANAGPASHGNARSSLGLIGDGLVAFEEYRGFFTMGTHTRTTTLTKDVFAGVNNAESTSVMPAGIGIGYFSNLSGFDVHEIDVNSNPPEWDSPGNRFINFRNNGITGSTDQRGIKIVVNDNLGDLGVARPIGTGPFNQSPNEMDHVEVNVSRHPPGMPGKSAGPDGMLCTADDVSVTLTAAQATNALKQSVGHESGHAVHIEHTFCFGDQQIIPFGQGLPNATAVSAGPDGVCNGVVSGDDAQITPFGQGLANAVIIMPGSDGAIDPSTSLAGDDAVVGTTITSGADGIAQSSAGGDDVQTIPVGQGAPFVICADTGPNGVSETAVFADDILSIPLGDGLPNQVCIDDGGDGILFSFPNGDDVKVMLTITTGPDGICDTRAVAQFIGVPSVMSSDVLVPVPAVYTVDDLDQVRFHLKHP